MEDRAEDFYHKLEQKEKECRGGENLENQSKKSNIQLIKILEREDGENGREKIILKTNKPRKINNMRSRKHGIRHRREVKEFPTIMVTGAPK